MLRFFLGKYEKVIFLNKVKENIFLLTSTFQATSLTSCRCFRLFCRLLKVLFKVLTLWRIVSACLRVRFRCLIDSLILSSPISCPSWYSFDKSDKPAFWRKSVACSVSVRVKHMTCSSALFKWNRCRTENAISIFKLEGENVGWFLSLQKSFEGAKQL